MSRLLIGRLIVLAFVLQGVAPVGADMLPDPVEQHCAGHDGAPMDSDCCNDEVDITGGCTTLCGAVSALSAKPLFVLPALGSSHERLAVHGASGPTYPPVTPPPIS